MPEPILVFRPGALGDTIVTADALAALRQAMPHSHLELIGNAPAGELLRRAGLVDAARSFDHPWVTGVFRDPPQLSAEWSAPSAVVAWVRDPTPFGRTFHWLADRLVIAPPEPGDRETHISDYLIATLEHVVDADHRQHAPALLTRADSAGQRRETEHPAVILHPGSGSPLKNWPADRFRSLVDRMLAESWSINILVGPADVTAADALGSPLPRLQPSDLTELTSAAGRASLLIGNDSGVTHLSARLGVPTVAIFGPTDPRRWAPRGPRVRVIGHPRWPSVDEVWASAWEVLG